MILDSAGTTTAKISSALLKARRTAGSPTMGMVLTLIIVANEKEYAARCKASMEAGREHPSRILLVVTAPAAPPAGRGAPHRRRHAWRGRRRADARPDSPTTPHR